MKKLISLALATGLFVFSSGCAFATPKEVPLRFMGKKEAPVEILEFVSMTCSHCAAFHNEILPVLKTRYVDTGKVRIVFKDFPLDGPSLKASALARCMPEDQFFPFVSTLYKNEKAWLGSTNIEKTLLQYAMLGGLAQDKATACLADADLMDAIVAERTAAMEKYDIRATPTFVINGGEEKMVGAQKVEDMAVLIDRILKKAEKKTIPNSKK